VTEEIHHRVTEPTEKIRRSPLKLPKTAKAIHVFASDETRATTTWAIENTEGTEIRRQR